MIQPSQSRRVWFIPVALILIYATVQAVAFTVLPERDTDGSIVRGGRVDVSALQVGDCFDWTTDISTGSIRQVDLLPCVDNPDAMHIADVVYSATTTAAWPGVSSLESFATD